AGPPGSWGTTARPPPLRPRPRARPRPPRPRRPRGSPPRPRRLPPLTESSFPAQRRPPRGGLFSFTAGSTLTGVASGLGGDPAGSRGGGRGVARLAVVPPRAHTGRAPARA